jgi:hypothetical protein
MKENIIARVCVCSIPEDLEQGLKIASNHKSFNKPDFLGTKKAFIFQAWH